MRRQARGEFSAGGGKSLRFLHGENLLVPLSMPPALSRVRPEFDVCPLCGGRDFRRIVTVESHPVVRCRACRLQFTNPQPSDAELAAIYGPDYILPLSGAEGAALIAGSKRATADQYLDLLQARGATGGRLVEVGCGQGDFLHQAAGRGFEVTGVEFSPFACARARATLGGRGRVLQGEIDVVAGEAGAYAVCVFCDVIEHVRDPAAFLRAALSLLQPGGIALVVTPSIDSWSTRFLGSRWMEFKAEHLFYFAPATITRQLANAGFTDISLHRGTKRLSLAYVAAHFEKYPVTGITPALRLLRAVTPKPLRERLFSIVASGLVAIARKP